MPILILNAIKKGFVLYHHKILEKIFFGIKGASSK